MRGWPNTGYLRRGLTICGEPESLEERFKVLFDEGLLRTQYTCMLTGYPLEEAFSMS